MARPKQPRPKQQRRAAARKLLKQSKGPLKPIDLSTHPHPEWMTRAFANSLYIVMIEDDVAMKEGVKAIKIMVQRHDDRPIPEHWREMQSIKNELFGAEVTAIEYYPAESVLVDKANIYWLWVFPDYPLPTPL